jgi:hypothetical protein
MKLNLFYVCILAGATATTSACAVETTLPDTHGRVPGGVLRDGGFGLGSGGITNTPPEEDSDTGTTPSSTADTCVSDGGFGLGSGGRAYTCAISPTS